MINNELIPNGRVILTIVQHGFGKGFSNLRGVTRADKKNYAAMASR